MFRRDIQKISSKFQNQQKQAYNSVLLILKFSVPFPWRVKTESVVYVLEHPAVAKGAFAFV